MKYTDRKPKIKELDSDIATEKISEFQPRIIPPDEILISKLKETDLLSNEQVLYSLFGDNKPEKMQDGTGSSEFQHDTDGLSDNEWSSDEYEAHKFSFLQALNKKAFIVEWVDQSPKSDPIQGLFRCLGKAGKLIKTAHQMYRSDFSYLKLIESCKHFLVNDLNFN